VIGPHTLHDRRSLAIHELVAQRVRQDPAVLEVPRQRVREWGRAGTMNPKYPQAWSDLLDGPIDRLLEVLVEPSEWATELRHVSPFAGLIDMATRERVWRDVKHQLHLEERAAAGR
jgi:hypothetical protein